MKELVAGLQDHLDTRSTSMVTCWKVVRRDGVVQGFTEHDGDLAFDGVTYKAGSGFTASRFQQNLGLAASNLNADGALSDETINELDLDAGHYDDAEVTLFWVNWEDVSERVTLDSGNLGEVTRQETAFSAEFRSMVHRLNQTTGRIYQRSCDAIVGDARCGVNLAAAAFRGTGAVTFSDSRNLVVSGIGSFDDGFFTHGVLTFSSGANDGLSFEVKSHSGTSVALWDIPPNDTAVSDTFSITAGCKKDGATCASKFSNIVNFRGFNHIPGNDLLQSYPNESDENLDGGSLFRGN